MKILTNHVAYLPNSQISIVVESDTPLTDLTFACFTSSSSPVPLDGVWTESTKIDAWQNKYYAAYHFLSPKISGRYLVEITASHSQSVSQEISIQANGLVLETLSDVLYYFKGQRCSGAYNRKDRLASFYGEREGTRNLSGGWYDASGDVSKYLSHLSFGNFMNPQQIPMVVWNLLESSQNLPASDINHTKLIERLKEEALFGADYLVRAQDPEGYFYITLFDKWSKDAAQREICAFEGIAGNKTEQYQAAWRQGGGVAIAALAKAYKCSTRGDFHPEVYLEKAQIGFEHLLKNNLKYCDDGQANIIDDYCKLLAATELYTATKSNLYLIEGRNAANQLCNKLTEDENFNGWFNTRDDLDRPFFSASEAGLPILALHKFTQIDPSPQQKALYREVLEKHIDFNLAISADPKNIFQHSKQYVQDLGGEKRASYFMPQKNETGYWWQGENARLASIAAACLQVGIDGYRTEELIPFANQQLDWILGKNPYDACMLTGQGQNNPYYVDGYPSAPGGICNGITAGFLNSDDVALAPKIPAAQQDEENWRWGEQWIPHAAWYQLAIVLQSKWELTKNS